jgi:hypothetical protein
MLEDPFREEEEKKPRLLVPVLIWAAIIGLVLALALHAGKVRAQEPVSFDCQSLAGVISQAVNYRDAGANVNRTVAVFLRKLKLPKGHAAVLEREIRRMWRERLDEDDAGFAIFKRCIEKNGDMVPGVEG